MSRPRRHYVIVTVNLEQKADWQRKAREAGLNLSDWLRILADNHDVALRTKRAA